VWGSTTIIIITTINIAATDVTAVIKITRATTQQKKRERAKSSSLPLSLSHTLISVLLHSGKEMMEKLTVTASTTTIEKVEVPFIYVCVRIRRRVEAKKRDEQKKRRRKRRTRYIFLFIQPASNRAVLLQLQAASLIIIVIIELELCYYSIYRYTHIGTHERKNRKTNSTYLIVFRPKPTTTLYFIFSGR